MTDWQVVFLGIMAVALAVMATMQIVTALALLRATREISGAIREIQARHPAADRQCDENDG